MRLWSIHPKYLDTKGLLALWREGLLARKVLLGRTKGYKNHPQLIRFRNTASPIKQIDAYLCEVLAEAEKRGYHFDSSKVCLRSSPATIKVTRGQIGHEFNHLMRKLRSRNSKLYNKLKNTKRISVNRVFLVVAGTVEPWEKLQD